ncbi:hypothetical protein [Vibrio mimicus]|uniref:hypothetical protein n=1 Tax=Vibrio mimicus TaxID=674 RepID=UPI0005B6403F|nr:hypothetical protein [Vibrio mimicus]
MEISIKFKTPGTYLSMNSTYGVISDLRKQIERGIFDALVEEYPDVSKSALKKILKNHVDLYLKSANKGSWEIEVGTVIAGIIGTVVGSLTVDLVINSESWGDLRSKIYSTSGRASEKIRERLDNKRKFGPFDIRKKDSRMITRNDKTTKYELNLDLETESDEGNLFNVEEEVNKAIEELKKRSKKN